MKSADGRLVIVFNGEIYNYPSLRSELERSGVHFRTRSDTEVLLHLYERDGAEMVRRLRGMFAFGIWDSRKRGLLLARDPYGMKPLYTSDDGWTLRFASQVKALIAGGGISRELEPAGVVGFYLFGQRARAVYLVRLRSLTSCRAYARVDTVGLVNRSRSSTWRRYSELAPSVLRRRENSPDT